ncbi:MAG: DNA-3-methyladenine glycosylase family protein [Phycisphaerales bacterium JB059]
MGSRLTIAPPEDYHLARDVCSYGYFVLAPNHWDVTSQRLRRALALGSGGASCVIDQPAGKGGALRARFDRTLTRAEQGEARSQITRMLRLDEDRDAVRAFHRVDPRWRRSGRARLFRSPTLFEDVIKTVTSCNVAWPSTVNMNKRLCETLGARCENAHAFPTPEKMARTRPGTLRGRCRVGYRDRRMVDLAKLFVRGEIDEAWLSDPATEDEEVFRFLITLPGIGPYAASNIMQLLGRYSRIALDTESVRHGKTVLGMTGTDAQIMKKVAAHFEPFGEHKFKSYWFELWRFYESKAGPSHTWEREATASAFTASNF